MSRWIKFIEKEILSFLWINSISIILVLCLFLLNVNKLYLNNHSFARDQCARTLFQWSYCFSDESFSFQCELFFDYSLHLLETNKLFSVCTLSFLFKVNSLFNNSTILLLQENKLYFIEYSFFFSDHKLITCESLERYWLKILTYRYNAKSRMYLNRIEKHSSRKETRYCIQSTIRSKSSKREIKCYTCVDICIFYWRSKWSMILHTSKRLLWFQSFSILRLIIIFSSFNLFDWV